MAMDVDIVCQCYSLGSVIFSLLHMECGVSMTSFDFCSPSTYIFYFTYCLTMSPSAGCVCQLRSRERCKFSIHFMLYNVNPQHLIIYLYHYQSTFHSRSSPMEGKGKILIFQRQRTRMWALSPIPIIHCPSPILIL